MNNELPSKEDEESKDGKEGSADFHQTSSNEPTVSEIEDERRARRAVFFRSGSRFESPVSAYLKKSGNQLNADEADSEIRNFLVRLAGDRQIEFRTDPVEMAQENDLLLLFGPEEEEEFARLALSFPDETVKRWATLLSGGSRSEAFGPRSRAERRDEATILKEFQTAVLRRLLGGVAVVAILVAGFLGLRLLIGASSGEESGPGLRFAKPVLGEEESDLVGRIPGGSPVAEPALTAVADRIVAVVSGEEPISERIRLSVPSTELPVPVGSISAAVFQYGTGQVALVGPADWVEVSCIRISVTTKSLRPLDVVRYTGLQARCPDTAVGRETRATCLGSSVLILAIDIPQRDNPKEFSEGGSGWAEKVRFAVEKPLRSEENWEVLAVRGTIEVPVGAEDVVIPRFGGAPGDELIVDLGETEDGLIRQGSCRLS